MNTDPGTADTEAQLIDAVDTAWTLQSAYLVFFMQVGFAMLESGMVQSKNSKNIALKNLVDTALGSVLFFIFGYAFAFGEAGNYRNGFMGLRGFFLIDITDYGHWVFQWAFCATAATISSGCMAERTQFTSYMFCTAFVSTWLFPITAHWIWSNDGWLHSLGDNGMIDIAGGTVVHSLGGFIGLIGAYQAGARLGRFPEEENEGDAETEMETPTRTEDRNASNTPRLQPHNAVITALGVGMLWYGWYGFNTGSTRGIVGVKTLIASRTAVVTTLCATSAGLSVMVFNRIEKGKYEFNMLLNGILGGLVASTAGCAVIQPWVGIIIGGVGGLVMLGCSKLLVKLKIDDPVDAAPVHLGAGIWGTIAVAFFADKELLQQWLGRETDTFGIFLGGGWGQLWIQLVGLIVVLLWCGIQSFLFFLLLSKLKHLRVNQDMELAGLDITKHGGPAYPDFLSP